ncbi:MAG: response regulator [Hyphomicrobiales bacterium]|nr:MAG: response regulator [Hyphomicrobiales bacterium]
MKRCMIVDDSSVIRKVASRILGGSDMIVQEAATGGDALVMCAAQMPDIVIVDARLPDIAAEDLIRRLVALSAFVRPHIVLCMTEFDVGAIMRAKRAGARGYILKPFNRSQLLERFRDMDLAA